MTSRRSIRSAPRKPSQVLCECSGARRPEEDARLKRLVAEQALENQMLRDLLRKNVRPAARRAAAGLLQERSVYICRSDS